MQKAAERDVISQISLRTLWLRFGLYCWTQLCRDANASASSSVQIPSYILFDSF